MIVLRLCAFIWIVHGSYTPNIWQRMTFVHATAVKNFCLRFCQLHTVYTRHSSSSFIMLNRLAIASQSILTDFWREWNLSNEWKKSIFNSEYAAGETWKKNELLVVIFKRKKHFAYNSKNLKFNCQWLKYVVAVVLEAIKPDSKWNSRFGREQHTRIHTRLIQIICWFDFDVRCLTVTFRVFSNNHLFLSFF